MEHRRKGRSWEIQAFVIDERGCRKLPFDISAALSVLLSSLRFFLCGFLVHVPHHQERILLDRGAVEIALVEEAANLLECLFLFDSFHEFGKYLEIQGLLEIYDGTDDFPRTVVAQD